MISQLTVFLANEKGRLAVGLPHRWPMPTST